MTALANFAIAGAAIVSPWWIRMLFDVSAAAALLLPIFGLLLAVLQIIKLLRDWRKPKH
ncbi:hypothetical protein [Taklimakanibacter deserti]|uniref:hypothetical protein n=1 Tax=Taklimakanibacter deserti TaxID=2267839 RepID=UPI0013C441B6